MNIRPERRCYFISTGISRPEIPSWRATLRWVESACREPEPLPSLTEVTRRSFAFLLFPGDFLGKFWHEHRTKEQWTFCALKPKKNISLLNFRENDPLASLDVKLKRISESIILTSYTIIAKSSSSLCRCSLNFYHV